MSACECEVKIAALLANIADQEQAGHPLEWRRNWINTMQANAELLRVEHAVLHTEAVPS